MLVVDAHLDLAMNALLWNRDLALSAHETRRVERAEGMTEKGRCAGTTGFPDLRAGEIGLVFATVIARKNHGQNSDIDFRTHEIAFAQAQGQLATTRSWNDRTSSGSSAPQPTWTSGAWAWRRTPRARRSGSSYSWKGRTRLSR